jgi:hypothetical protein
MGYHLNLCQSAWVTCNSFSSPLARIGAFDLLQSSGFAPLCGRKALTKLMVLVVLAPQLSFKCRHKARPGGLKLARHRDVQLGPEQEKLARRSRYLGLPILAKLTLSDNSVIRQLDVVDLVLGLTVIGWKQVDDLVTADAG